ncbi:MAG: hypothetical protein LH679_03340 [Cyanobacteria bacterium CAN_BIN43]|nr:hypothetical protein [Cyanobacteria bacterium CAN_BIN43]
MSFPPTATKDFLETFRPFRFRRCLSALANSRALQHSEQIPIANSPDRHCEHSGHSAIQIPHWH